MVIPRNPVAKARTSDPSRLQVSDFLGQRGGGVLDEPVGDAEDAT